MSRLSGFAACLAGLIAVSLHACQSDEPEGFEPECTPNQFRACVTHAATQGHEQCVQPGVWAGCVPSVFDDAAYSKDVQSDVTDAGAVADADADDAADIDANGEDATDADGA